MESNVEGSTISVKARSETQLQHAPLKLKNNTKEKSDNIQLNKKLKLNNLVQPSAISCNV